MKTRIITVALAMSTVVAFAQKKEIRKAENAVEDGEFVEAKNFLSLQPFLILQFQHLNFHYLRL